MPKLAVLLVTVLLRLTFEVMYRHVQFPPWMAVMCCLKAAEYFGLNNNSRYLSRGISRRSSSVLISLHGVLVTEGRISSEVFGVGMGVLRLASLPVSRMRSKIISRFSASHGRSSASSSDFMIAALAEQGKK